jgi:hypothetical protein
MLTGSQIAQTNEGEHVDKENRPLVVPSSQGRLWGDLGFPVRRLPHSFPPFLTCYCRDLRAAAMEGGDEAFNFSSSLTRAMAPVAVLSGGEGRVLPIVGSFAGAVGRGSLVAQVARPW